MRKDVFNSIIKAVKDSGNECLGSEQELRLSGGSSYSGHEMLSTMDDQQWKEFCLELKKLKVTSLVLDQNKLWKLSIRKWKILFDALNVSQVTSLDLSGNQLNAMDDEHWGKFCDAIAGSKITSLSLNCNSLLEYARPLWPKRTYDKCRMSNEELEKRKTENREFKEKADIMLGTVEANVQAFCTKNSFSGIKSWMYAAFRKIYDKLDENSSYEKDGWVPEHRYISKARWKKFCDALKKSNITSLYLDYNFNKNIAMWNTFWDEFGDALKKSNITSLSLVGNYLNAMDDEFWGKFCDAIAGSKITSLDLCNNQLLPLTKEKWDTFGKALENSQITSLCLFNNVQVSEDVGVWEINISDEKRFATWSAFCNAIAVSKLTELKFSCNAGTLTEEQVKEFNGVLSKSNFLKKFQLNKWGALEINDNKHGGQNESFRVRSCTN